MNYVAFVMLWVGAPLACMLPFTIQQAQRRNLRIGAATIVLLVAVPLAIVWDRQAALWQLWRWNERLILGLRLWGLPIEEVSFIVLLAALVIALVDVLHALPARLRPLFDCLGGLALAGTFWACTHAWQMMLASHQKSPAYLPYLMQWAMPLLALQWLIGGKTLWRARQQIIAVVIGVTLWFSVGDAVALHIGIWRFAPSALVGIDLRNVPIEEVFFFGSVTALLVQAYLVAQSLLAALHLNAFAKRVTTRRGLPQGEVSHA